MPSLDSAYAQLDRAGKHLIELKRMHDEICAVQAKSTIVELKTQATIPAGETVEAGQIRYPQPPVAIPLRIVAGETANCLRAALDYMVGQLAWLDSKARHEGTQFPIANSPKDFKEARRRGFLDGVNEPHVTAIENLQPCNGCDWTRLLAVLSNFAKHDDLILLKHGVLITTEKFPVDPTDPNPFKHRMRVDLKNVINIALNEGFPLIATLEMLKSQVAQTLDAVNPEFK